MTLTKWNLAETYRKGMPDLYGGRAHAGAFGAFVRDEKDVVIISDSNASDPQTAWNCDDADGEIVCRVAASGFLTARQAWLYARLFGRAEDEGTVAERLRKLTGKGVLREIRLSGKKGNEWLVAYGLDSLGIRIARDLGANSVPGVKCVPETAGTGERHKTDGTEEVMKVVVANGILLEMLMQGTVIENFGFLETTSVRPGLLEERRAGISTTLSAATSFGERILVEVVRDNHKSLSGLVDKVFQYERITSSGGYVLLNENGDVRAPRLVICGESARHNERIFEAIAAAGFPIWRCELLFTTDADWERMTKTPFRRFNRNYGTEEVEFWTVRSAPADASVKREEFLEGIWKAFLGLFGGAREIKAVGA